MRVLPQRTQVWVIVSHSCASRQKCIQSVIVEFSVSHELESQAMNHHINLRVRGNRGICVGVCSRGEDPFVSVISYISDMLVSKIRICPYHSRVLSRHDSRTRSVRKGRGKLLEIIFGNVFISIRTYPPYCIVCRVDPPRSYFCCIYIP